MVYDQMESEYLPNRRIQIKKCFIQGKNIVNVHLKRELTLVSILFFSSKGKWNQNYICSTTSQVATIQQVTEFVSVKEMKNWTERQHFSQLKAAKLKHNLDNIKLVCTTKYILFQVKKFPISLEKVSHPSLINSYYLEEQNIVLVWIKTHLQGVDNNENTGNLQN